jgi:acetoin utilization deacetylase AcuC-like enzyme
MKIIYHEDFFPEIDDTPAGEPGRLDTALGLLQNDPNYKFLTPEPAPLEALQRAHSERHIKRIQNGGGGADRNIYEIARLAAGGALLTADIAKMGNPAFGLIRPPGHHCSHDSCWGFCYLCNQAIALLHLRETSKIKRAFVLDFDLHYGDGNLDILDPLKDYEIVNPTARSEEEYLDIVKDSLKNAKNCDIITASAGFDQGINDWGRLIRPEGYFEIGRMMKEFAEDRCEGKRFALLEGGYNFADLGNNIKQFCEGFR